MKRSFFSKRFKKPLLAVPAAALMLGAAHAGTTVGLNFQAWYYDSGATPQTIGYGAGYQTTGFPVTAKAFGVEVADWSNADPMPSQAAFSGLATFGGTSTTFAGGLSVNVTSPDAWQSGIGEQVAGWNPETVAPGDNEVTWGYLDDGNSTGTAPAVSVSGLATLFPSGYVVATIAANSGVVAYNNVDITDGPTTNVLAYSTYYVTSPASDGADSGGTVGLSPASGVFTSDTININPEPKTSGHRSVLAGFIITDKPVVDTKPIGGIYNLGNSFTLSAGAIGIAPLTYQWLKNGTPIANATNLTYSVASAVAGDAANYQLVAANAYGAGTSVVAAVSVLLTPTFLANPSSVTNYQTMNATLAATVGGQSPISYKWFKNGTPITGATNTTLALTNLQAGDAAAYALVATNVLGSATSSVVNVTVVGSLPPYEGFNYDTNSGEALSATTAGGTGWSGGWVQSTSTTSPNETYAGEAIVANGATYYDATSQLVTTGGAAELAGTGTPDFGDIRALQCSLNNGTVYLSFIGQIINTGWGGVELTQTSGANDVAQIFLGAQWDASNWGWGGRGGGGPVSSVPCTTESLLVYRLDFTGSNTLVRLYINPPLASEPATPALTGTWNMTSFNKVQIVSHGTPNNNGILDELRIGGTWAAVTPNVPRTDAPSIVTDLSVVTNNVYTGTTLTNYFGVSGAPPLHYYWVKNGSTHVGTDNALLILTSVSTADSGNYSCAVSNIYGAVFSQTNYLLVTPSSLAASAVIQDVPGAWWPLIETSGSIAYDYSGAGNNGTINGSPTLGAAGPQPPTELGFSSGNTAYAFDGSSSYIDCGTTPSLAGTTDFTVEAWVNTTNSATGVVVQQRSSTGYNGEYQLEVNANGTVYFSVFGNNASQFGFSSPASGKYVNDGNWHHIAAKRSGSIATIYIDGAAMATATNATVAPLDATIKTFIGADQRGSSSYFNGLIADVAIYSHAVSAANIASHAAKGVLGGNPLVLSTGTGGFIEDTKPVGTPHPGLNYGINWLASSVDYNSYTRTGVAQFPLGRQMVIPANADFNSTTGTIAFWMRTGTAATGNGTILFDRRTSVGTVFFIDGSGSGTIDVQTYGGGNFSGGFVADGGWHHVALTYDQSAAGSVNLYVDGSLVASQPNAAAWSWPTNQEIELGRSHDTYWQNYAGEMDDVRIYSRILTDAEVATIGTPASSDTLIDTSTLVGRYNFTTAGVGKSLNWPVGKLLSSPTVAPGNWQSVSNVNNIAPFISPAGVTATTNTTLFYRVGF